MRGNLMYRFTVFCVRVYTRVMLKFEAHWHGDLPPGPKLFVANHPSATDPFLIHLLSSEHLSVLISGNAFSMPLFGRFLHQCGQISVNAGQGRNALDQAHQRLQSGHSVGIFPEGWISPDIGYNQPHSGAARLALSTGVPVIPVGIYLQRERRLFIESKLTGKYTYAYWYLRGPYSMTIGEPMLFTGDIEDKNAVHSVTSRMMARIHELAEESERRVRFSPSGVRLPVT